MIYGQEIVNFRINSSLKSSIIQNSLKWVIQETPENIVYENKKIDDIIKHKFMSPGEHLVTVYFDYNDTWNNIYTHSENVIIEVSALKEPEIFLTNIPELPSINEVIKITTTSNETYPRGKVIKKDYLFFWSEQDKNEYYEHIQNDKIIYPNDLSNTNTNTNEFEILLNKKHDQKICINFIYNNGWEEISSSKEYFFCMKNLPPKIFIQKDQTGICSPKHKWDLSSSIDPDDLGKLSYKFQLFIKFMKTENSNNSNSETSPDNSDQTDQTDQTDQDDLQYTLINSTGISDNPVFEYLFQYKGDYRLIIYVYDINGEFSKKIDDFSISLSDCMIQDGTLNVFKGEIQIEPNRWQMIAIPQEFGFWDTINHKMITKTETQSNIYNSVFLQLQDKYGSPLNQKIEIFSAYIGDYDKFLSFIPNYTQEEEEGNFVLVHTDSDDLSIRKEVTAFWLKNISDTSMIIEYG